MGHAHQILDAIKDYETRCAEFSDKCTQVLNGEVNAYYTKCKITDSFWLLAGFYRKNSTQLKCQIWRGTYNGKVQGNVISNKTLAESVVDFPELKKCVWIDGKWPSIEELGYT